MTAVLVCMALALALTGWWLLRARPVESSSALIDRIDAMLPQTQCERCGYRGCRPYAEAIAIDKVDVDLCPPGGEVLAQALASMLGRTKRPDVPGLFAQPRVEIDPVRCIGCTKCIQACPVDAILGASKQLHVILQSACTGCLLCIPPCPVDCIVVDSTSSANGAQHAVPV